jgi:hypothetical protein
MPPQPATSEKHETTTQPLKTNGTEATPSRLATSEKHGRTTQLLKTNDQDGTLLHRIQELVQQRVSSAKQEARHIQKWSQIVIDSCETFTKEILRHRNWVNPALLVVFAVVANGEPFIQVEHAFGQLAPEDKTHPYDGLFGCFLGDRTIVDFQGETIIQEPAFTMLCNLSADSGIQTQPAADRVIRKMDSSVVLRIIKGSRKASVILVLLFLPLPLRLAPYFLAERCTNREVYVNMAKHLTKKWTEAGMVKEA